MLYFSLTWSWFGVYLVTLISENDFKRLDLVMTADYIFMYCMWDVILSSHFQPEYFRLLLDHARLLCACRMPWINKAMSHRIRSCMLDYLVMALTTAFILTPLFLVVKSLALTLHFLFLALALSEILAWALALALVLIWQALVLALAF